MATFTVTTTNDVVNSRDGVLSLREAITQANATTTADTINFAAAIEGKTLVLTGGQLSITHDLTINGDRDESGGRVTINANQGSRVFMISGSGTDTQLDDLAITDGQSTSEAGGGIFLDSNATLQITDSAVTGNAAVKGGGIFANANSTLTLQRVTLSDNQVGGYGPGGGIHLEGASARVMASTITDNVARFGGGIASTNGNLTILNSTIILLCYEFYAMAEAQARR